MKGSEYEKYMKSDKWKFLRKKARERVNWMCEFCGGKPDAVHHVKYPSDFNDDNINNLVVCCHNHHALCHGKRDENFEFDCKKLNNISDKEQMIFCSVCKELFYINDMDIKNGKWVCHEHD